MADRTAIEWSDATWNPTVGCSLVSPGCTNCYAMKMAARLEAMGQPIYRGMTQGSKAGAVWTGKVELSNWGQVTLPLRWKRPRRIFVNSMSDLFHEKLPDDAVDQVFAVMALARQHTFQVLTKRPERMRAYISDMSQWRRDARGQAVVDLDEQQPLELLRWPLPNVHLGVSVEDQARADERIPHLLATPAAVRFVSAEPLLGPVYLTRINLGVKLTNGYGPHRIEWDALTGWEHQFSAETQPGCDPLKSRSHGSGPDRRLSWIIVGGESGPGARPFNVAWARSVIAQCRAAGVACFVKQLGANVRDRNDAGFDGEGPTEWEIDPYRVEHDPDGYRAEYQGAPVRVHLRDRKGGDWSEWPEDLRVREFPS